MDAQWNIMNKMQFVYVPFTEHMIIFNRRKNVWLCRNSRTEVCNGRLSTGYFSSITVITNGNFIHQMVIRFHLQSVQ